MSLSIQFFSLLVMIGTGIVAGAVIDHFQMLSIAHHTKRSTRLLYSSIEVMAWMMIGSWAFYVLYLVREGEWRMYDPLAQLTGLLLYMSIFYKPIRFLGRVLYIVLIKPLLFGLWLIRKVVTFLFTIIMLPVVFIYKVINRIFSRILGNPF